MLTAAGASATVRNNRGETCLHRAAVGGHVEAVSAIVGVSGGVVRCASGYGWVCQWVWLGVSVGMVGCALVCVILYE